MKDYLIHFYHNLPISVIEGLLLVLSLGVITTLFKKGLCKGWRQCGWSFLVVYLFLLFYSTVFQRTYTVKQVSGCKPFWSYRAIMEGNDVLWVVNVMNVLAFVPIGFLLCVIFRQMKWWKVLIVGLCISTSIELLQLFLERGLFEFDDVFHNTLGAMIGYGLFLVIKKIYDGISKMSVKV